MLFVFSLMFSFIFFITIADSTIQCFECNSFDDPRCHDPFNYNYTSKEAMPDTTPCNGCCVKMVQFIGTGTEKICESENSLIFVFVPWLNIHRLLENSDELFFSSCTIKHFWHKIHSKIHLQVFDSKPHKTGTQFM